MQPTDNAGAVILVACNKEGCTYSRAPNGTHRLFVAGGPWDTLNGEQKDAVCRFVWPKAPSFTLVDALTEDRIASHP